MSKILSLYPPKKLRLTWLEREHYATNQKKKRLLKERRRKEQKK